MAVIEAARNLAGISDATSSEFGEHKNSIVGLMTEWDQDGNVQTRKKDGDLGGTMRLGAYDCKLQKDSLVAKIYGSENISERHRHRYEVNINYIEELEKHGVIFSGMSPDGTLPEIIEIPNHAWFVGVQFHPEFNSRPFAPHPLFSSFVEAAIKHSKSDKEQEAA